MAKYYLRDKSGYVPSNRSTNAICIHITYRDERTKKYSSVRFYSVSVPSWIPFYISSSCLRLYNLFFGPYNFLIPVVRIKSICVDGGIEMSYARTPFLIHSVLVLFIIAFRLLTLKGAPAASQIGLNASQILVMVLILLIGTLAHI